MNPELRKKAKKSFKKGFLKVMNNVVFGKTMENVKKNRDMELVKQTKQRRNNFVSKSNCPTTNFFLKIY